ncbi:hypothetical protein D3C79_677490 [compost metagenome]
MDHQRDAHGLERATRQFGAVSGRRRGHGITINMGEVDAALLDHGALAQYPGAATAAIVAGPGILHEAPFPIGLLQCPADLVLQLQQEGLDLGHVRFAHLVSSQAGSCPACFIMMSRQGARRAALRQKKVPPPQEGRMTAPVLASLISDGLA